MQQAEREKANFLEIVGAWLHIWTPPRDVQIPPVPWRKIAIGGAVGALVIGIALAIMIPRVGDEKRQAADRFATLKREAAERNRARITKAQAPHRGEAASLLPAAGASATEREGAREELMASVKADILSDARARVETGEMKPVNGQADCERTPGTPTSGDKRWFDCFIATTEIKATEHSPTGSLGYPFRAVVDYGTFAYTWCKIEQVPGEMLVLLPSDVTLLPPACRAPRR